MKHKLSKIKAIISDVDGVMTDGGIYYDTQGNELKKFNVKDGQICSVLKNHFILGIFTGRESKIVEKRFVELGFHVIQQGVSDKMLALQLFISEYNLDESNVLYIGDDINDLKVLQSVGLSACPADAIEKVIKTVDYVCKRNGGEGIFREVADLCLKSNNKL